jgi:hypothetical protein
MTTMFGPVDDDQQNPKQRNMNLALLLNALWADENIATIRRAPVPTHPPDQNGPKRGQWVAETVT